MLPLQFWVCISALYRRDRKAARSNRLVRGLGRRAQFARFSKEWEGSDVGPRSPCFTACGLHSTRTVATSPPPLRWLGKEHTALKVCLASDILLHSWMFLGEMWESAASFQIFLSPSKIWPPVYRKSMQQKQIMPPLCPAMGKREIIFDKCRGPQKVHCLKEPSK